MLCHVHTQVVLLPHHLFPFETLRLNSRGQHNNLGILFPEFHPNVLHQLWRETLNLLCSQVKWSCNLADQG